MGLLTRSAPRTLYKTEAGDVVYGMMAEFPDPGAVSHAAERVRDAGHSRWDVYAPFPIHDIDVAMGFKHTPIALVCALVGLTGAGLGFLLQWWVTSQAYPIVVQGKPFTAWEPFTPVTFEIGILFTAFSALGGMLAFNKLPMFHHPLFKKERFLRVSDDRFVICIEADDPKFDPAKTRALLEQAGATRIDLVEE